MAEAYPYRPHTVVHKFPDRPLVADYSVYGDTDEGNFIAEIPPLGHDNHKVIVTCVYCHAANAISNPTCVRCGAPMGETKA